MTEVTQGQRQDLRQDLHQDLRLAADFASASEGEWRKLVDGVLKGAPYEKLVGKTYDGIKIQPIYPRSKGSSPVVGRAAAAPWQIMQRVDHPDAAKANAQILTDLENGATGIEIEFADGAGARGFGVADAAPETLKRLFDGVMLDAGISIALNPVVGRGNAGETLAALLEAQRIDPAQVDLRINYQALSTLAVRGSAPAPWSEMAQPFAKVVRGLMDRGFKEKLVLADGRPVHDAGGSEAQELAFALALAVAYLRMLETGGIALEDARAAISFRLSADADQFLTSAKFRALRGLWARIETACGLAPKPVFIAAETAWRMLTQRDPYVNMLRATIATFSAGLGGANAVTVLPHTLALGLPDPFARRMARNTQLILLEESNLAKVADPMAGAGGIEALTHELCETAWALFQEIEASGGVFAALQRGLIQSKVAATRKARDANIAKRRFVLTGASEFPNLSEADVAVEMPAPPARTEESTAAISFAPLAPMRLAEPFERLRDCSDAKLKGSGKRPAVFLANLGSPADFTARTTFARSLFEAGGIAAIEGQGSSNEGSSDPAALAADYKASGAPLACLCSSDKVYAADAIAAAKALHEAGARHIYLAGRPGVQEADLRAAGVGSFVFAGCDALTILEDAYTYLE
jgi:methylmalonyl-CoA mutase